MDELVPGMTNAPGARPGASGMKNAPGARPGASGESLVPHTGFEPVVSALRGRCPGPLDECGAGVAERSTGRQDSRGPAEPATGGSPQWHRLRPCDHRRWVPPAAVRSPSARCPRSGPSPTASRLARSIHARAGPPSVLDGHRMAPHGGRRRPVLTWRTDGSVANSHRGGRRRAPWRTSLVGGEPVSPAYSRFVSRNARSVSATWR